MSESACSMANSVDPVLHAFCENQVIAGLVLVSLRR
jgi:hypothetical protein